MTDFSDTALIEAIETNLFEYITFLARAPQVDLYDNADMLRFVSGIPFFMFNAVFRAQLPSNDIGAQITEILAFFKTRQLPMLWWTGPQTQPTDLGTHLEAQGLTLLGDGPGMALNLRMLPKDLPTPSGLTIAQVTSEYYLKQYWQPYSVSFELPDFASNAWYEVFVNAGFGSGDPVKHYVGFLKNKPVACSTLFLGAGVAGIYNVGTVPEARRQGIGTTMTLHPLREARSLGHRIGVISPEEIALGVYQRIGFQEYCTIGTYLWTREGK